MAAAVPVVASDIPGCRDALGEQGGVLVPPADSAQLAKTIIARQEIRKTANNSSGRPLQSKDTFLGYFNGQKGDRAL